MAKYDCPKCGSSNTKSLQAIWNGGNRTSNTSSGGFSISSRGTVRVSSGRANTRHTSTRVQNAAPPSAAKPTSPTFAAILAFVFSPLITTPFASAMNGNAFFSFLIATFSLAVPFVCAYFTYKYFAKKKMENDQLHAQDIQDYANTWLCQRCDNQYVVND